MIRLTQLFAAAAVVLAITMLSSVAGNTAEARNAPTFTERVEMTSRTREADGATHTIRVVAASERGSDAVLVHYSTMKCYPGPTLSFCIVSTNLGPYEVDFDFSLGSGARLWVDFERDPEDCGVVCPIALDTNPQIIELEWNVFGGVEVDPVTGTRTKKARVIGGIKGVEVNGVGTISVTQSRPPDN